MQTLDVKTTVPLDGPLTVVLADSLKSRLINALADARSLEIDVSGATDIDVSVLQILLAARKMAEANGTTITVLPDDRLMRELDRCGIPFSAICHDASAPKSDNGTFT